MRSVKRVSAALYPIFDTCLKRQEFGVFFSILASPLPNSSWDDAHFRVLNPLRGGAYKTKAFSAPARCWSQRESIISALYNSGVSRPLYSLTKPDWMMLPKRKRHLKMAVSRANLILKKIPTLAPSIQKVLGKSLCQWMVHWAKNMMSTLFFVEIESQIFSGKIPYTCKRKLVICWVF